MIAPAQTQPSRPEPDEPAGAIIENLEAGLNSFRLIANAL